MDPAKDKANREARCADPLTDDELLQLEAVYWPEKLIDVSPSVLCDVKRLLATIRAERKALIKINWLRSNIIATQNAGWSNTVYPLVAILDRAGFECVESDAASRSEHLMAYGGAGGVPGEPKR